MPLFNPLLNPPNYPADRYAPLADRFKRLLATRADVVFIQAEAILALEATASSLARPGMTAVNIVTSPYGAFFGAWLRRGGATVHDVVAAAGQPIDAEAVAVAAKALPTLDLVAVVHAETSNGALNPLAEIAALARSRNALLVVDAVASFGGHPFEVDALGVDVAVIGPQKALSGPTGISVASVSARAWAHMAKSAEATPSNLALADIKRNWLDRGRGGLPGMPPPLEFWALEAAVDGVEAEGLAALIARHERAASAEPRRLAGVGVQPWIADDRSASTLVTSAPVPPGIDAKALVNAAASLGVMLGAGFGPVDGRLVRLDHTGARANFATVLANVIAYGAALASLARASTSGRRRKPSPRPTGGREGTGRSLRRLRVRRGGHLGGRPYQVGLTRKAGLGEDIAQVRLDGVLRNLQQVGGCTQRLAFQDEGQHARLAGRQVVGNRHRVGAVDRRPADENGRGGVRLAAAAPDGRTCASTGGSPDLVKRIARPVAPMPASSSAASVIAALSSSTAAARFACSTPPMLDIRWPASSIDSPARLLRRMRLRSSTRTTPKRSASKVPANISPSAALASRILLMVTARRR